MNVGLEKCVCGSKQAYVDCCEPFHLYQAWPETAEQLMRSRYSAFALHLQDYLLSTWEESTRPGRFSFEESLEWTKLRIVKTRKGGCHDQEGWVWFKANFLENATVGSLREKSFFTRNKDGHWQYVSGEASIT